MKGPENIKRIRALILGLGEYYGEAINEARLRMFGEALSDLVASDVEYAIREIMRDPKVVRMPLAAAIRGRLSLGEDVDSMAIEAANRIWEALARCGHNNPDSAREFIGEMGWAVVQRQGGWGEAFSLQTETGDVVGLKAQWRELAKALHARAKAGTLNQAPGLPAGKASERVRELTKGIG